MGSEDYEFHMAALERRIPAQVVPDPLHFVRELLGSMKKTTDNFMADFRGLVPVLNSPRYADMAGAVLLLKGMLANSGRSTDKQAVSSLTQFAGIQRINDCVYAFMPAPSSLQFSLWIAPTVGSESTDGAERGPVGLPLGSLDSLLPFAVFVSDQWYDVSSPRQWPYIGNQLAAPYTDELTRVRYVPVRQYTTTRRSCWCCTTRSTTSAATEWCWLCNVTTSCYGATPCPTPSRTAVWQRQSALSPHCPR